ncbi:MAG TPA: BamA/TamA family outer membrane protein [Polyangia bacterium]|nr:BamA/TamA family outer membrane protein [Polyangia bacterium]
MSRRARAIAFVAGALSLVAARQAGAQSKRELNFVPLIGGNSDVGVGGGVLGDWAQLAPGHPAFKWRLELASITTFKPQNGHLIVPYTDNYLELVVPKAGPGQRLRIDARLSYTDERTMKYSGLGNASPPPPEGDEIARSEYGRIHPTASLEVRTRVFDSFYVLGGANYTYDALSVGADTILAQDHAMGPPEVRAILGNFDRHGVALLTAEAQIDTRDDEIVTRHGQFHTLRFRASPRVGDALPYGYERLTLTSRIYRTPSDRWLTLAARVVGDALLGDPPFYELARFDETNAIGGVNAVRGVPAQRYYGKVKAFGNLEAISPLWPFHLRNKAYVLGAAVFFDAGRSWTELTHAHPELDGTGLGLKYGIGGGIRLQEGRTFLLRLDVAWSPDATPIGAYFAAGEIF